MIASLLEFNHGLTPMTPLPSCLLCLLQELPCVVISWALSFLVPFSITPDTNLGTALTALGHFSPVCVTANIFRFDPFTTPP
jgi:hypothetical protein